MGPHERPSRVRLVGAAPVPEDHDGPQTNVTEQVPKEHNHLLGRNGALADLDVELLPRWGVTGNPPPGRDDEFRATAVCR
jgi:hypothetical protein